MPLQKSFEISENVFNLSIATKFLFFVYGKNVVIQNIFTN